MVLWVAWQVLVKEGIICICAGGGGIPVALEQQDGGSTWRRHGVEAVIDKVAPHRHPHMSVYHSAVDKKLCSSYCVDHPLATVPMLREYLAIHLPRLARDGLNRKHRAQICPGLAWIWRVWLWEPLPAACLQTHLTSGRDRVITHPLNLMGSLDAAGVCQNRMRLLHCWQRRSRQTSCCC